jgi:hypothetical protein
VPAKRMNELPMFLEAALRIITVSKLTAAIISIAMCRNVR